MTPWKWSYDLTAQSMEEHAQRSAFRAMLEQVLVQTDYQWKKPKCHMKKSTDFSDYVKQVIVGFAPEMRGRAESLLHSVIKERECETRNVMVLKLLQTIIQPVVESLIVYDHVVKLREAGLTCSPVQVFSQLVSPRNTLIFASKKGIL